MRTSKASLPGNSSEALWVLESTGGINEVDERRVSAMAVSSGGWGGRRRAKGRAHIERDEDCSKSSDVVGISQAEKKGEKCTEVIILGTLFFRYVTLHHMFR